MASKKASGSSIVWQSKAKRNRNNERRRSEAQRHHGKRISGAYGNGGISKACVAAYQCRWRASNASENSNQKAA